VSRGAGLAPPLETTMGITFDRADGARWYGFDFDVTPGEPALVGLVVSTHVEHDVRVMSDVWADKYTARVWDAAAGVPRTVVLGYADVSYTHLTLSTKRIV